MSKYLSLPSTSLLMIVLVAASFYFLSTTTTSAADQTAADSEISSLIEDLGADSFFTRTRAKEKLQLLGLEAFDDLHGAQFHPDNEIAMAARFLVSSLMVSWSKESDPPEVHEALSEYGAQDEVERTSRIDMLAELPKRKGLIALARLARFETSLRLSRLAALAAMRQPIGSDQAQRRRSAEQIQLTLGDSERQSALWLQAYAADLTRGNYSVDRWRELITQQRDQIDAAATDASNRDSVLELVRICAAWAAQANLSEEAVRLAVDNIVLIQPTTRDLIEACDWALDQQLHPFVLKLQQYHDRMFDQHPILLYGAAESLVATGNQREAEQLAEQASKIRPLPADAESKAKLQPKEVEEIAQAHRLIGSKLKDRGLFHWAEREYRQVIDLMEIDNGPAAIARNDLGGMFAELLRHQEVVDLLQPLADRAEKDAKLRDKLNKTRFSVNVIQSNMLFHQGLALIGNGETEAAKPILEQAYRRHQSNVDILIAMYRLDGDEDWNRRVKQKLVAATQLAELLVKQTVDQARRFGRPGDDLVSNAYNQYAWLIANTEGDYQRALDYSLKSLDVHADPQSIGARLDTCARCYFAVGDIDNAILTQQKGIKLLPHSPPLQRQLKEFLAAKRP